MDWITILVQIPIIAAFIWFVLEMNKRQKEYDEKREISAAEEREKRDKEWRDFLSNERRASEATLGKVANRLDSLGEVIEKHDQKLDMAIAVMKERTGR